MLLLYFLLPLFLLAPSNNLVVGSIKCRDFISQCHHTGDTQVTHTHRWQPYQPFFKSCDSIPCSVRPLVLFRHYFAVKWSDQAIFFIVFACFSLFVTCQTGRPRAIYGQRYPLPCFEWLWVGVRGSRAAAPKVTKSCRTQGDFCSSCLTWMRCYIEGWLKAFKSLNWGLRRLM